MVAAVARAYSEIRQIPEIPGACSETTTRRRPLTAARACLETTMEQQTTAAAVCLATTQTHQTREASLGTKRERALSAVRETLSEILTLRAAYSETPGRANQDLASSETQIQTTQTGKRA